ncbi:MAG: HEAT repeat domain-containing protein [Planctomycetes bacterium]|nr:HEAT repeat domain-containing protein [Planctomycetota bacterium]
MAWHSPGRAPAFIVGLFLFLPSAAAQESAPPAVDPVSAWADHLADEREEVRSRASGEFNGFDPATCARAAEELASRLRTGNPPGKSRLLSALGRLVPQHLAHREAVEIMSRALSDPDLGMRKVAGQFLGRWGRHAREAVPALVVALPDVDPNVRFYASAALAEMREEASPAVPNLVALLADPEEKIRVRACATLAEIGAAAREALPALGSALEDGSVALRLAAAKTVLRIDAPSERLLNVLRETLKDADPRIRAEGASTIAWMNPSTPLQKELTLAAADPDPSVRAWAILATANLGADAAEVKELPPQTLEEDDLQVRIAVSLVSLLRGGDPAAAIRSLGGILERNPPSAPQTALSFLRGIPRPLRSRLSGAIIPALRAEEEFLKRSAASALFALLPGTDPDESVTGTILSAIDPGEWRTHEHLEGTLLWLAGDGPAHARRLLEALPHANPRVRAAAADLLGRLGRTMVEESIPRLLRALGDSDARVRGAAVKSLGVLAAERPAVYEALQRATTDRDPQVQAWALSAVGRSPIVSLEQVRTLVRRLGSEEHGPNFAATGALGQMVRKNKAAASPLLVAAIPDARGRARVRLVRILVEAKTNWTGAVDVLAEALEDEDEQTRAEVYWTCKVLTLAERAAILPTIAGKLDSVHARDRAMAAEVLRDAAIDGALAGPEGAPLVEAVRAQIPRLVEAARGTDGSRNGGARKTLMCLGASDAAVLSVFEEVLRKGQFDERPEAALALSRAGEPGIARLVEVAADPDERVRCAALHGLGPHLATSESARAAVLRALTDPRSEAKETALSLLARFAAPSPEIFAPVRPFLADPSAAIRRVALLAVLRTGRGIDEIPDLLVNALRDTDETVRGEALRGLLGDPASIASRKRPLEEMLRHADAAVRRGGAFALLGGGEAGDLARSVLREALTGKDPTALIEVYAAMPTIGKAADALLEAFLEDSDPEVTRHALALHVVRTLARGDAARTPMDRILPLLKRDSAGLRAAAARAIGTLRPLSDEAFAALAEAERDPAEEVREAAFEARVGMRRRWPRFR